MGWFDVTFIILKDAQERKSFLTTFHTKLAKLNVHLDIDEGEFICYNDTRSGEEKEITDLSKDMSVEDVIDLLSEWPGLGILSYRHPDFSHYVTINYLTWDDKHIHGFTIGFNGKEVCLSPKQEKSIELINQLSELVDCKYVVGSIDDDPGIDFNDDLPEIVKYIEQTKFKKIDKRKYTTNK